MSTMMRAVQFEAGGPEKMSVGEVPVPELKQQEVLIKVITTAINRADTLQRKGQYPPPSGASSILGLEAAGLIHQVGPECNGKWKVGDRVMALLNGGGNAEYAAVHEDHVTPVPKGMSMKSAAAIPEVWLTAFQLLHFIGGVKSGETVLVHAGGSGVGTAAVQLIKLAGGRSLVTAGSEEKIKKALELGAEAGFNYKTENFAEHVLKHTDNKGVNLILDCVGASFWEQNVAALAVDGRWVLYGLLGGGNISGDLLAKILRKRINITGTTLRARSTEYKAELVHDFTEKALPAFQSGQLHPIIGTEFPLEQIADAHRHMEENRNTGKILITVSSEGKEEL